MPLVWLPWSWLSTAALAVRATGGVSREHAIALLHRYAPPVLPAPTGTSFVDAECAKRYVAARVHLEQPMTEAFVQCADEALSVYVIGHAGAGHHHVHTIVWPSHTPNSVRAAAVEQFVLWHAVTFENVRLTASDRLEEWPEAWPP